MANLKWELGAVSYYDSFEPVDRVTSLAADYSTPTQLQGNEITLSDSVANYRQAPFHIYESFEDMPGSIGYIGPSTDATYEGAIEAFIVAGYNASTDVVQLYPTSSSANLNFHAVGTPFSAYKSGDPVIFKTVPPGWAPPGANTLAALNIGVMPIGRKEDALAISRQNYQIGSENAYKYINKYGVRILSDLESANTNRYISKTFPVNTLSPRIPRYRLAWSSRIGQYNTSNTAPGTINAQVTATVCDAAGNALSAISQEGDYSGAITSSQQTLRTVTGVSSDTNDWHTSYALIGGADTANFTNNNRDSVSQFYYRTGGSSENIINSMYMRSNRIKVDLKLTNGSNTFFDVDDMILEHASGTSQEYYGFYEIQDFPTEGSVSWSVRKGASSNRNITSNNTIKVHQTFGEAPPKFELTAQFNNVTRQTYDDLRVLEEWQKRNHMVSLRTFNDSLPDVMVGFITISSPSNEIPDLNRVSFSFKFEEA